MCNPNIRTPYKKTETKLGPYYYEGIVDLNPFLRIPSTCCPPLDFEIRCTMSGSKKDLCSENDGEKFSAEFNDGKYEFRTDDKEHFKPGEYEFLITGK